MPAETGGVVGNRSVASDGFHRSFSIQRAHSGALLENDSWALPPLLGDTLNLRSRPADALAPEAQVNEERPANFTETLTNRRTGLTMAAAIQIRSACRPRGLQACNAVPLRVMHFENALRSLVLAGETLGMGAISSCDHAGLNHGTHKKPRCPQ